MLGRRGLGHRPGAGLGCLWVFLFLEPSYMKFFHRVCSPNEPVLASEHKDSLGHSRFLMDLLGSMLVKVRANEPVAEPRCFQSSSLPMFLF